jgi:hypothetical protein
MHAICGALHKRPCRNASSLNACRSSRIQDYSCLKADARPLVFRDAVERHRCAIELPKRELSDSLSIALALASLYYLASRQMHSLA